MKKRILSIFLALALCLTLLPTAAFAEGNCATTGHTAPDSDGKCETCGETIVVKLTSGTGESATTAYYATFSAAQTAAQSGDTITLLDFPEADVEIQKSITLNLNDIGFDSLLECTGDGLTVTIQGPGRLEKGFSFSGKGSVLTLKGKVECWETNTQTGGTLNIESDTSDDERVTLEGLTITGTAQSPCTVNIKGGVVDTNPLTVTGTENGSVTMEVTGGEIETLTVNGTENQASVTLSGGQFQKIECTTEGRTVGSFLPSENHGYYNAGSGEWEDSTETSIESGNYIYIKILPLTGVTMSPSGTTSITPEEFAAGRVPTFTATAMQPDGATGELNYWWIVYEGDVYDGTNGVAESSREDIQKNTFTFPTDPDLVGAGTYTVECKVSDSETDLTYTAAAQVHIGKPLVPEDWYPTGATGLIYDDDTVSDSCLVSEAFIEAFDAYNEQVTFYFRLGEDGNFVYTNLKNIKAKNAGTYTVYWYIDGDNKYEDVGSADEPRSFQVTIAPKTVTVDSVTLESKDYDGKTTATIDSVAFSSDGVTYTAEAEFDDPNVGENKSFTATVKLTDTNYTFLNESGQPTKTCTFKGSNGEISTGTLTGETPVGELTVYNCFAHTYEYDFSSSSL